MIVAMAMQMMTTAMLSHSDGGSNGGYGGYGSGGADADYKYGAQVFMCLLWLPY